MPVDGSTRRREEIAQRSFRSFVLNPGLQITPRSEIEQQSLISQEHDSPNPPPDPPGGGGTRTNSKASLTTVGPSALGHAEVNPHQRFKTESQQGRKICRKRTIAKREKGESERQKVRTLARPDRDVRLASLAHPGSGPGPAVALNPT